MQSKQKPNAGGNGRKGYGNGNGHANRGVVRYGEADAELVLGCIDSVTAAGDAILFGRTADGGAYVVRVLSDAGSGVWYPPSAEALGYVLTEADHIARGI